MPKDEIDPEDPMAIVGVELPASGEAEIVEMADCFVEEFARMGWPPEKILRMFRMPFYAAAHRIFLLKGEGFVRERIEAASVYFEAQGRAGEDHHA